MIPARKGSLVSVLLSDTMTRLCAGFTLLCILMPVDGIGFEICSTKRILNLPCPGCGVTRSGACLARGEIRKAMRYHPLSVGLFPCIASLGALGLLPTRPRRRLQARLILWLRPWTPMFWVAGSGFVLFGMIRCLCVWFGLATFPAEWP